MPREEIVSFISMSLGLPSCDPGLLLSVVVSFSSFLSLPPVFVRWDGMARAGERGVDMMKSNHYSEGAQRGTAHFAGPAQGPGGMPSPEA